MMAQSNDRDTKFRLAVIWLAIMLLGSFWLTIRAAAEPVTLVVLPVVPRQGEPVIATFKMNNPGAGVATTRYQFYVNGKLIEEGTTTIAGKSEKTYKYAYANPFPVGQQLNFVVRTQSEGGQYEKAVSAPPYPPQVWSSFVSFASFSTSVMSSMSTMTYYQSTFGGDTGQGNLGVIIVLVLLALLVFIELTQTVLREGRVTVLGRLNVRLSPVSWILFIIFMGIIFTKVLLLIGT